MEWSVTAKLMIENEKADNTIRSLIDEEDS